MVEERDQAVKCARRPRGHVLASGARAWHLRSVVPSRARSVSRRALGGAAIALCVVAQLATAGHFVLVRHSFCSLHGEALDVDGSGAKRELDADARHAQHDSVGSSHDEPGLDTHDHCALAVDRSSRVGLPPAPATLIPVALFVDRVRARARVERDSGAVVLLLAPKTSPPA